MSEALFRRACEVAREVWPDLDIDDARFRAYLDERMPPGQEIELRWADLWLACGCVDSIPAAVAALERWGFPSVDAALARIDMADPDRREVKQLLRHRLLVRDGSTAPRLAEYAGRGDLRGYLRIAATRLALNYLRDTKRRELPVEDELPDAIVAPELRPLFDKYRVACEAALAEAIGQLDQRERTLLRQHLIDGVAIQQLAAQHRVHRHTVSRWLDQARESVVGYMSKLLHERHGVGADELASVLRLVRSQLDISLPRRLADGDDQ
jgi:RNA polymerase sigma-70 factor (ECF subfamily)